MTLERELMVFNRKKTQAHVYVAIGYVCLVGSIGALGATTEAPAQILAGSVWLLIGCFWLSAYQASMKDGICRAFHAKISDPYYPPLEEWGDSLEARGAFEVNDNA